MYIIYRHVPHLVKLFPNLREKHQSHVSGGYSGATANGRNSYLVGGIGLGYTGLASRQFRLAQPIPSPGLYMDTSQLLGIMYDRQSLALGFTMAELYHLRRD